MVQQCFDAHYAMSNALLNPYRFLYVFDNALTTYVCAMRAGAFFLTATYVHLGSIICIRSISQGQKTRHFKSIFVI